MSNISSKSRYQHHKGVTIRANEVANKYDALSDERYKGTARNSASHLTH
ncbi:MAG: hypothetical protein GY928_24320 [Colwellia sp.]|nr:hypothetical protein [Colwellia sp.]